MSEHQPGRKVVPYRPTAAVAEKRVRELARATANIQWSQHALQRMEEREIFDADAVRVLREGICKGEPEQTPRGEWKCKMVKTLRGNRETGVVVVLTQSGRLFVKTVEWEDYQ